MKPNKAAAIAAAVKTVERLSSKEDEQKYLMSMLVGLNLHLLERATFYNNHLSRRGYEWGN